MFVAGPNEAGRAPQVLAPLGEGHCQTSASRRSHEAPEAATGRRASEATAPAERLPMSIRNGTSSSADPQTGVPSSACGRRLSREHTRRFVDG